MIFVEKKKSWCGAMTPEDPVISIFAGCLANHDRAHSLGDMLFNTHLCNHHTTAKWWWDLGDMWVLGVGMSTLDTTTFLYVEDRGLQVPMTLDHVNIVKTQCCDKTSRSSVDLYRPVRTCTDLRQNALSLCPEQGPANLVAVRIECLSVRCMQTHMYPQSSAPSDV